DVALDRLGRDGKLLGERGRVRAAPFLDLVVDRLEAPPQRSVLERAGAAHGNDSIGRRSSAPSSFPWITRLDGFDPSPSLPRSLQEREELLHRRGLFPVGFELKVLLEVLPGGRLLVLV